MDVGVIAVLKKYMDSKFAEMTNVIASSKGLKYREFTGSVTIPTSGSAILDLDLVDVNSIAITGIFVKCNNTRDFTFQIFDKASGGFEVYNSGRVTSFTDSLLLVYNDVDATKKLHIKISSFSPDIALGLTIKIVGFEMRS